MKPESTGAVPPPGRGTSWVWACPPTRSSASNSVTWWVLASRYAAVSPETPPPTMAAVGRGRVDPVMALVRSRGGGGWVRVPDAGDSSVDDLETDALVALPLRLRPGHP